jgi:hypothetical protein
MWGLDPNLGSRFRQSRRGRSTFDALHACDTARDSEDDAVAEEAAAAAFALAARRPRCIFGARRLGAATASVPRATTASGASAARGATAATAAARRRELAALIGASFAEGCAA